MAKAKKFSFGVQCVPRLVETVKTFCKCVLSLETAACAKVSKGGKSPGKRLKRKKDDFEAEL